MVIFVMPDGKDPAETLDYSIDMSRELVNRINGSGTVIGTDTITGVTWTVPTGLTEVTSSMTASSVTIWLSGGSLFSSYDVRATITTSNGRTYERSFIINIVEK